MKTFEVQMYGRKVNLYCKRSKYLTTGNTVIHLYEETGEHYATLSTNPDFKLPADKFYSCRDNYAPILIEMFTLGLIDIGDSIWRSGYSVYQSFTINESVFTEYEKENK